MIGLVLLVVGGLAATPASARASTDPYGPSVVSLQVSFQEWNPQLPWTKRDPATRLGNAVVVEGNRLLTTAQMVASSTYLEVQKFGRPSHVEAQVAFVDVECNLALLSVAEPGFFEDLTPARLADATPVEGTLLTARWQNQQLEVAASRVKRILVEESWYGRLEHIFLHLQTDLTGGGWSEPVFGGEALVGLTVSQQSDQRARAIPVELISRFLDRARDPASYRGFPVFGVKWQYNEDPVLAAWLGQTGAPQGIVIRQVPWGSSGCNALRPLDILLAVDGAAIDANGFVNHPRFGRILFQQSLVERHQPGDVVSARVLRDKAVLDLTMTLRPYPAGIDLVPSRRGMEPPPYVIAGGLVFQELDADYLRAWGRDWTKDAPLRLMTLYTLQQVNQRAGRRRVVFLSGVLPSPYTTGYEELAELPVARVNGREIGSLADLEAAFRSPDGRFHTIRLEPNAVRSEIVLDATGFEAATKALVEEFGIPDRARLALLPLPDPGPECPSMF